MLRVIHIVFSYKFKTTIKNIDLLYRLIKNYVLIVLILKFTSIYKDTMTLLSFSHI